MNRTFIAAVAFAWQAALYAILPFVSPDIQQAEAGPFGRKVARRVLPAHSAKVAASASVDKGVHLLEAGHYEAAIESFSQAIAEFLCCRFSGHQY